MRYAAVNITHGDRQWRIQNKIEEIEEGSGNQIKSNQIYSP